MWPLLEATDGRWLILPALDRPVVLGWVPTTVFDLLTDPAIHSLGQEFGATDGGLEAMCASRPLHPRSPTPWRCPRSRRSPLGGSWRRSGKWHVWVPRQRKLVSMDANTTFPPAKLCVSETIVMRLGWIVMELHTTDFEGPRSQPCPRPPLFTTLIRCLGSRRSRV